MRSWPYQPGVPAAGHVTNHGVWHPGAPANCARPPCVCADCGHPENDHGRQVGCIGRRDRRGEARNRVERHTYCGCARFS